MLLYISLHYNFFPLLIVAFIAWITPVLLALLRVDKIPSVIVEIVLGYILGLFFMKYFSHEDIYILNFLALSGFVFLMFIAGLEIDIDAIRTSLPRHKISYAGFLKNPLLTALFHYGLAVLISYTGTFLLSQFIYISHKWYFALILSTTSVGIIIPVLKNRGEIQSRYGQMLITAATIADIFSIVLFTSTAYTIINGFRWELLYVFILVIVFYVLYRIGNRVIHWPVFKKVGFKFSHSAMQVKLRGTLFIILIFVVISQFVGEEIILLGAFLSGLLMSGFLHRERSLLMIKLDSIGFGFFIPVFFIMVGMQFDASALVELNENSLLYLLFLLLILYLLKIVPSFIWSRLFGWRKALAGGILLSSRLSLIIAASAIGLEMAIITPEMNTDFILMAIITCLLSPVLYSIINQGEVFPAKKVIIIGGSSTGVLLARRLNFHEKKVIIIENDPFRCNEIKQKGINVIKGDGKNPAIYKKIRLNLQNPVILETGSNNTNIEISKMLHEEFQHENIIVRTNSIQFADKFKSININPIDEKRIIATAIENIIFRPNTYYDLVDSFENFKLEEILVTNKKLDGTLISKINWPGNVILIMIKRNNINIIPHGNTYISTGDLIHVFGTDTALKETEKMLVKQ